MSNYEILQELQYYLSIYMYVAVVSASVLIIFLESGGLKSASNLARGFFEQYGIYNKSNAYKLGLILVFTWPISFRIAILVIVGMFLVKNIKDAFFDL